MMEQSKIQASAPVAEAPARQYHDTDAPYPLPNDAIEQDRLDTQAVAIVEMMGQGTPFLGLESTTGQVKKAVDIGCGTGVATLQLAKRFPQAQVCGVDLTMPPEGSRAMAPSNVTWTVGNVLDNSDSAIQDVLAPGTVDYVFGRMLVLGINDWNAYFANAAQALKAGGIIEHQDIDIRMFRVGTNDCVSDDWEWRKLFFAAAAKTGMNLHAGTGAAMGMKEAGLEVVGVQTFEYSFVPSDKAPSSVALGRYAQAKLIPTFPELVAKMLSVLGIEGEKLERLKKDIVRDLSSEEGVHAKYTVTIARKP